MKQAPKTIQVKLSDGSFAEFVQHVDGEAGDFINPKTGEIVNPVVDERLAADRAKRRRMGEQAFQVEHYLELWKTYSTPDNWRRVIEAVDAYDDETPLSRYFVFTRPAGRAGRSAALGRVARVGSRGKSWTQAFRKSSKSWTVAR